MSAPLQGIKVLDFSTLLPGPMAGLLLAEAGAEVIKIERPGVGDEMRAYAPKWGTDGINFGLLNRGKKSLAIDLKDATKRAQLEPLIKQADVIIEQFRPGVMARLALSYNDVCKIKPDIIYCSITGYGQTGPKRDVAGHDLNYISDAGLLALSRGDADQPVMPPALIADIAAGSYPAVLNILLALRERDRNGSGAYLDIAMTDNLFPFMFWAMGSGLTSDHWPGNGDSLLTGGSPRYQLYPTHDGKMLAAAPLEEKFWQTFCAVIDLATPLRDDSQNPAATRKRVAEIIADKPAAHWRELFVHADCCCTIVQSVQQAMQDPHFKARGLFNARLSNADGLETIALPVPIVEAFRKTGQNTAATPRLADNNDDYLA